MPIRTFILRSVLSLALLCTLSADRAAGQCHPEPKLIPDSVIEQAKTELKSAINATPEQAVAIDEWTIKVQKRSGSAAAYTTSGWLSGWHTVLCADPISGFCNGGGSSTTIPNDVLVAVVAQLLWHEWFHMPPGETGGTTGAGVPQDASSGGIDCDHIGLQYQNALNACQEAQNAAAAGNVAKCRALCATYRGLRGYLGLSAVKERARTCKLEGHSSQPGPPTWGFPNNPYATSDCNCNC